MLHEQGFTPAASQGTTSCPSPAGVPRTLPQGEIPHGTGLAPLPLGEAHQPHRRMQESRASRAQPRSYRSNQHRVPPKPRGPGRAARCPPVPLHSGGWAALGGLGGFSAQHTANRLQARGDHCPGTYSSTSFSITPCKNHRPPYPRQQRGDPQRSPQPFSHPGIAAPSPGIPCHTPTPALTCWPRAAPLRQDCLPHILLPLGGSLGGWILQQQV